MKKLQILLFLILISFNVNSFENKIILKIDNDIITSLDILEEINNLKFFNQNLREIDKEEIYQIGLNSLINYKIKKQEVLKYFNKIVIENEDYIKSIIENNYKKLNFKNISDFKKVLKEKSINFENYEEKIKVNILWNQIIYSKYNNQLVVNEIELKEKIKRQNNNKKAFNLSEIVFQIENLDDLKDTYEKIKSDINKLGFQNAALKYSVSNTSNEGGDLGWVDETFINNKILEELKAMSIGSITNPIRIPSGFLILKVKDVKKIETDLDLDQEVKKLINYENYEEKIKVNILWNQIIYSKYNSQLVVNEIELKEKIKIQNDNKKAFNLSEIVFQIENLDDLKGTYETIKSDINKLGFENAVLKYSVSNTSNEGGDLGWVDETLINNKILEELKAMSIGSITNPIRIPSGFLILKVNDVKKIKTDLDIDQEIKRLIDYEKEKQLNIYAGIYFNKIKKNVKINAP